MRHSMSTIARRIGLAVSITVGVAAAMMPASAQVTGDVPAGRPDAIIDLRTPEGVELLKTTWRYSDARIVATNHRAPGADLKPSGTPVRTYDIAPRAGERDFDDSRWSIVDAGSL